MAEKENDPRAQSNGSSNSHVPAAQRTPCDHLMEAAHWLDQARRSWNGESEAAVRIAELHIALADRVDDLGACGDE